MSLSLPNNPTPGQQTTQNGRIYEWDGYAWNIVNNINIHAATHSETGVDPITLSDKANAAINLYLWSNFQ